jgi:L-asparaginase / beta-aspartyl-peptidase
MWTIIVHGGAKDIEPEKEEANRRGCNAALTAGKLILESGGRADSSLDSLLSGVFEDDPTFNAGFGSELNADGEIEMCSALMDGETLDVGAVAAIKGVRNPIGLARLMLREDPILLVAEGARRFAIEKGVTLIPPAALIAGEQAQRQSQHDTVGAIALDVRGNLVVGTSTGGLSGSAPGRVGDSPQPGCGFYADNRVGAVAFTGDGEKIASLILAAKVMRFMEQESTQAAVTAAITELKRIGGEAGAIALDRNGRIGWAHNSSHMAVAFAGSEIANPRVHLRRDEERRSIA